MGKKISGIINISFLIVILLFVAGCSESRDFNYGIGIINNINSEYNTTMEDYPDNLKDINSMLDDYKELKNIQLSAGQEPLNYILDYRILNLEAEKLFIEGQKYGNAGTTKLGFGCKQRPLVIESVSLRNSSALKGFEAVNLLNEFIAKYPDESKSAGLSPKNALFLNATFHQISEDARKDSNVINSFCKISRVLELYQEEFRKKTSLIEDYISSLDYEQAVKIWKESRGIK